jgi:hypothetical protein
VRAAGGKVLEQSAGANSRAAVVGGFPAGGLRQSATMIVPLLTLVLLVAFGAEVGCG